MTLSIFQLLYFYLIGLFLALLEIEIEGPNGWAKNLPTKRMKLWWYQKFGKEVTGYHLILQIFLLLFMHLPLILENRFNWELEVLILSQYFFFLVYWDYLWFVLNPHFRLKGFKKGGVPWHASWILGLPTEYWLAILAGVFLPVIVLGSAILLTQLTYLAAYLAFTMLTIFFYWLVFREKL